MLRIRVLFMIFLLFTIQLFSGTVAAQAPATQWQKRFGGPYSDGFKSVCQTADGGYIAAGIISLPAVAFSYNFWIVKTDSLGNLQWQKHYGGFVQDIANTIIQTTDGGYIVGGEVSSNNGDISGNHGGGDIWILKLDALGNIQWKKCYGGTGKETIGKILQLADGSYMVAGGNGSVNGDLAGTATSGNDVWLFHLNASGTIIWQKTYGGTGGEMAQDIKALPGGGFIVACASFSNNGDVTGNHGSTDYWIFRTDAAGNILWQKSLGGSDNDMTAGVALAADGGFVVAGYTASVNGDVTGHHGGPTDTWGVKLDSSGNLLWQKALGGSGYDMAMSITGFSNNSFVIASATNSADGDVSHAMGASDIWLTALDNSGNLLWEKSYGGSDVDGYAFDRFNMGVIATGDGGLAFAAMTGSPEVAGSAGGWDGYLVKLHKPQCDTVVATHDTSFCSLQPVTIQLQPAGTATTYTWNTGAQTAGISVQDTGTYWRIATSGCNLHTDSFYLHHAVTVRSYMHDTAICSNATVELAAGSGFDRYLWSNGDTTDHIIVSAAATYWRRATDACRTVTDSFMIRYKKELPVPELGPDRELCSDTDPQIGSFYPDVQYSWNTGETSAYIHPVASGMYTVRISNGCATAQDSLYVKLYDCNDCFFIPTAFTPNADGRNDVFGAVAKCAISSYRMNIYDRWGQLVFVSYDTSTKWDGNYGGVQMELGTYYYSITCLAPDGRTIHKKGDVTLVR